MPSWDGETLPAVVVVVAVVARTSSVRAHHFGQVIA
jgi:hypothetical protein